MSEFFLSTDFGILLCVFFFGVAISGRLAAWIRSIHAGVVALRKRTLRYRLGEIEVDVESLKNVWNNLHTAQRDAFESAQSSDLEERIKVIEDWLTDRASTEETEDIIKKKAKERTEAIKKLS